MLLIQNIVFKVNVFSILELIKNKFVFVFLETAIYANSSIDAHDGKKILVDTWIILDNDSISYQKVRHDDCLPLESGYSMPNQGKSFLKIRLSICDFTTYFDFRNQ